MHGLHTSAKEWWPSLKLTFKLQRLHSAPGLFLDQVLHILLDGGTYVPDSIQLLPFWVRERPIKLFQSGDEWACLPTTHCDQQVRLFGQLRCEQHWFDTSQVNAVLLQGKEP